MKKLCAVLFLFLASRVMGQQDSFIADGIVYGITSEQTVQVLPYYHGSLDDPYSGDVVIPQTVVNGGTAYTVTALEASAFEGCTAVSSLSLPATIRSIGAYCFYGCNFTSLQLPDSLRRMGDYAFGYSRVGSLHLPACFEHYGVAAFWARNLTSVSVDDANPRYRSIGGWLYSRDSLTLLLVPDGVSGTIVVPSFVRHIGDYAFGFNSRATAVSLPEGITSIGNFAFNCCSAVNNIVIPASVVSIGRCPFSYCPQLTNLTVADGNSRYVMDGLKLYSSGYDTLLSCHRSAATVTLHPNLKVLGGFENNTWVRNIDIPAGVTEISDNCFCGCAFTTITLPTHMERIGAHAFAQNNSLASVTMPASLLSLGEEAFSWCMNLTAIAIPDSLRVIPKEAFNSCPRLASVIWGNAVEEIGPAAFWAMAATHLDLPPTLKKLDDLAFAACDNSLLTVTVHSQLDTMGEAVFRHANLDEIRFAMGNPPAVTGKGPLYDIAHLYNIIVPCGSIGVWQADSYWGQFADLLHEDCSGVADPETDDVRVCSHDGIIVVEGADGETVRIFDIMGREYGRPHAMSPICYGPLPRGVYLVKVGSRPARKIFLN